MAASSVSKPGRGKLQWKPGTMLMPVPAVMVTCCRAGERPNIITIAWAGTVCTNPPMVSISLMPARHSFDIIKDSGEFVINIPSVKQAAAVDWCGVVSGRDVDKFGRPGLTAVRAKTVGAPLIAECPIHLECKVRQVVPLGSHHAFIAEVTMVQILESLITPAGRMATEKADLLAFAHGHYYALGRDLGHFGFSVRKRK